MPEIEIEYCVPCGLLEDAEQTQHELLEAHGRDLDGVRLRPGHGGVFRVSVDGELVWDKDEEGGIDREAIASRVARHV
jgi:selenoprotein W-related protein